MEQQIYYALFSLASRLLVKSCDSQKWAHYAQQVEVQRGKAATAIAQAPYNTFQWQLIATRLVSLAKQTTGFCAQVACELFLIAADICFFVTNNSLGAAAALYEAADLLVEYKETDALMVASRASSLYEAEGKPKLAIGVEKWCLRNSDKMAAQRKKRIVDLKKQVAVAELETQIAVKNR